MLPFHEFYGKKYHESVIWMKAYIIFTLTHLYIGPSVKKRNTEKTQLFYSFTATSSRVFFPSIYVVKILPASSERFLNTRAINKWPQMLLQASVRMALRRDVTFHRLSPPLSQTTEMTPSKLYTKPIREKNCTIFSEPIREKNCTIFSKHFQ